MNRYALKIEYDGRQFVGWQRQKNGLSVQQAVEDALGGLEPEAPPVVAAGRTDSGVHALGQVAHCELRSYWSPKKLREALNSKLWPKPVSVLRIALVGGEFSAAILGGGAALSVSHCFAPCSGGSCERLGVAPEVRA